MQLPEWWRRYLPLLLTILAIIGGTTASVGIFVDDGDPSTPPKTVVEIKLPKLGTVTADTNNEQSPAELVDAGNDTRKSNVDIHEDARDETPPGVSPQQVAKGQEKTEDLASKTLREPQEPAGAQAYSCPERHVVNQSALSSRRVGVALHFTVSNPGSLDAIRGLFNRRSFGASSNYGFELFNLRCQQWVPDGRKAWAQGAANSAYNSIEIITNDRSRASWLATPALQRGVLAALVADLLKRHGAPPRKVDPVGCVWPAGVTDHDSLECGNTHWDVGGNFPWDVFMAQVRRAYKGGSAVSSPLTTASKRIVRGAANPKGTGHSRSYWCQRNAKQRAAIRRAAKRDGYKKRKRGVRYQALGRSFKKRCR